MIGPQPPPPPPPPRPQQQEGEPSSEERQRRQYQGQPTSEEEGMGRPGGDDTARQAQQQRIEPAILQLWAEVGERLNRNQTVVWAKAVDSLECGRRHIREYPAPPLPNPFPNSNNSNHNQPQILAPSSSSDSLANNNNKSTENNSNNNNNNGSSRHVTNDDGSILAISLPTSNPGRDFLDRYMIQIVSILLDQQPLKIGEPEKECVEKSLRCALQIIKDDIDYVNDVDAKLTAAIQRQRQQRRSSAVPGGEGRRRGTETSTTEAVRRIAIENNGGIVGLRPCSTILALGHIFSRKSTYYKSQRQWSNAPVGAPELRLHMISVFRRLRGFTSLSIYLNGRVGDITSFPNLELCTHIVGALYDGLPSSSSSSSSSNDGGGGSSGGNNNTNTRDRSNSTASSTSDEYVLSKYNSILSVTRAVSTAIMKHILLLDESTLKRIDTKTIEGLRRELLRLYKDMSEIEPPIAVNANRSNSNNDRDDDGSSSSIIGSGGGGGGVKLLYEYFSFWRELSLRLITSSSLPLRLFGWDEISTIITESERTRPPPRAYMVSGAGTELINGLYEFDNKLVNQYGYVKSGIELQYHKTIQPPNDVGGGSHRGDGGVVVVDDDSADVIGGIAPQQQHHQQPPPPPMAVVVPSDQMGIPSRGHGSASAVVGRLRRVTLFRCTMRSSQKWWFLSECDEHQPGTDKDVDYYQHKSKREEEGLPSKAGWFTCRPGSDPPPTLEAVGKLVPRGEEYNTLEHQLAIWAIDNGVIELVLGDGIHREVISRSAGLIKFLAGMSREGNNEMSSTMMSDGESSGSSLATTTSKYCLQASHLLLAWKTSTNKADAAVSSQIYQLLVSILPSLPSSLAIPLIEAIRSSLDQSGPTSLSSGGHTGIDNSQSSRAVEKQVDFFAEVSEFCSAIAERMLADSAVYLPYDANAVDPVREAILNLQWAILSHKDALALKSYESIKKFVLSEIGKNEPTADKLRITFLIHTRDEIIQNGLITDPNQHGLVDEAHALHMVQLAKHLLEGFWNVEELESMIIRPNPGKPDQDFPMLIFTDLISYIKRRSSSTVPPLRKAFASTAPEFNHIQSLSTRLKILRFVYGLNAVWLDNTIKMYMSSEQLMHLWNMCDQPIDRELVMMFLADSSKTLDNPLRPENSMHNIEHLSPCFLDNVYIFENLFCADTGGPRWEDMNDMAYQSFQQFDAKEARFSSLTTDALWRICLSAGNDVVASHAMNDLLAMYNNKRISVLPIAALASEGEKKDGDQFSQRIFNCLVQVKEGLSAGNRSSERSAERCIRILSAAIDQCHNLGCSVGAVVERLNTMFQIQQQGGLASTSPPSVEEYLNLVPHGLRGVYACNTVSIIAKATFRGVGNNHGSPSNDGGESSSRNMNTQSERFSLEIHPLQTLASIKSQIAAYCKHDETMTKLNNLTGQRRIANSNLEPPRINNMPDTTLAGDLGIMEGSEIIALLSDKVITNNAMGNSGNSNSSSVQFDVPHDPNREQPLFSPKALIPSPAPLTSLDLTGLFSSNGPDGSSNSFFDMLISVLESLPVMTKVTTNDNSKRTRDRKGADTHSLAWDLLSSMPTNSGMIVNVHRACSITSETQVNPRVDEMAIESTDDVYDWSSLLDFCHFERSVYVMQILDSFLRPAPVMFSSLPKDIAGELFQSMSDRAKVFRSYFIQSGGFDSVLRLFIISGKSTDMGQRNKMGNECALRIIRECFFNDNVLSEEGRKLIASFAEKNDATMSKFLESLVSITIHDCGVSHNAIVRVLKLARLMLESGGSAVLEDFTSLADNAAETFLTSVLLWKGSGSLASTSIRSSVSIRKSAEEMILAIPLLSASAFSWLVKSLKSVDPFTDGSEEFFSVLLKLVNSVNRTDNAAQLRELGMAVCVKLASCPGPNSENAFIDHSTGVLCGCLKLLIALIEVDHGDYGGFLVEGSSHIIKCLNIIPWSGEVSSTAGMQWELESMSGKDKAVVDLIGSIFDGFISSPLASGSPPICCDKVSRQLAFDVISAAAQACSGGTGYRILSLKINGIIANVSPTLRHRWGQNATVDDRSSSSRNANSVRYSGLKNQGCTCYMNSVLQQLFMMPALRKSLCSAKIPTIVRSSGGGSVAKGSALVGKKILVHWENGNKYDATVSCYNEVTGMHTINYCPIKIITSALGHHHQQQPMHAIDVSNLPLDLPEEYTLTAGRPGKETGAFEIVLSTNRPAAATDGSSQNDGADAELQATSPEVLETPDECSSRKLLEEVQRTFVNLDEARGRCFDPRALVEASHCLKLEFDVWQQNDASEFAMKLLDRLEISLKKWSPSHFKFLANTFGMKKTTQKICRECGLKSNREEHMMNIDCQIRNKSSIHEALAAMCEDEIMEGDNKVLCEFCKVKQNTVLRTAISSLPDVLVLSLKRFDLDYTTFETVKLNSRCEFGESLNVKKYTLQAKEVLEAAAKAHEEDTKSELGSMMELEESETKDGAEEEDPLSILPDEDYEYRLTGVLVHAGVAQGGHYYSFVKDRISAKWYRFDDEDVTPFDTASIEHECFGGKVKNETKFLNGNTHTVEREQFANALMLFYEKVKPEQFESTTADAPMVDETNAALLNLEYSNGYDVFQPEVRSSNSTHSWQAFLLTEEFQNFMKEILEICAGGKQSKGVDDSMDITPASSPSTFLAGTGLESWRVDAVRMSLSFVFDILFHLPLKKIALEDWSKILMGVFISSCEITAMFVSDLAKRTHQVYENWIRAYSIECPDEGSRRTALHIFVVAISSLLRNPSEQMLLQSWTQSWSTQVSELEKHWISKRQRGGTLPTRLIQQDMRPLEDIAKIGVTATSIGIIISYLSELVEVSPRYHQASIDLCFFIRELATASGNLRSAMVEAHFIARLACLLARDNGHNTLRILFPGSSISHDVVDAISREETFSSNSLGMSNSHNGHLVWDAIGYLLGIPWIKQEPICFDTGETNRGRNIRNLTPRAVAALTTIFEESNPHDSSGMVLRDIQNYLQRCGHNVPTQRIDQLFSKHAVDGMLTLKGFLAYYRETVLQNELQVHYELAVFGFRPDLSRRHYDCIYGDESNGTKPLLPYCESIAHDVAMNRTSLSKIHRFTEMGLTHLYLLNCANVHLGMTEYILAACSIGRTSTELITESLYIIHDRIEREVWGRGNQGDSHNKLMISILQTLIAIPDEKQQERITTIMINDDSDERHDGLITKPKRIHFRYPNEYRVRNFVANYTDLIKLLAKQPVVANWMSRHRSLCSWIQPDEDHPESENILQSRSDRSGRRGGGHQNIPIHQNHDPNADDESYLDEDSRSDEEDDLVREMIVHNSGTSEINGIYIRAGSYDDVSKYTKRCFYEGRDEEFSLFRCKLTDNTRRWYISIVPMNSHPGTTKDIDFYAAAASYDDDSDLPPRNTWICIPNRGLSPSPEVYPKICNVPRSIYYEGDESHGPGTVVAEDDSDYL